MSKFIAGAIGAIWTVACLVVGFISGAALIYAIEKNGEKNTYRGGSDNE